MLKFFRKLKFKILGILWQEKIDNTTYTLYNTGWVVISDKTSKDMLPLSLCSPEFVERIIKELK